MRFAIPVSIRFGVLEAEIGGKVNQRGGERGVLLDAAGGRAMRQRQKEHVRTAVTRPGA